MSKINVKNMFKLHKNYQIYELSQSTKFNRIIVVIINIIYICLSIPV